MGEAMQIGRIQGFTRELGKSQGYMGLPLRDGIINCSVNGPETPTMTTAWLPTPAELAALNAGAAVHVRLLGVSHPPIMVEVGDVPAEDAAQCIFEGRAMDGSQNISASSTGRTWCRTHGFDCPQLTGRRPAELAPPVDQAVDVDPAAADFIARRADRFNGEAA